MKKLKLMVIFGLSTFCFGVEANDMQFSRGGLAIAAAAPGLNYHQWTYVYQSLENGEQGPRYLTFGGAQVDQAQVSAHSLLSSFGYLGLNWSLSSEVGIYQPRVAFTPTTDLLGPVDRSHFYEMYNESDDFVTWDSPIIDSESVLISQKSTFYNPKIVSVSSSGEVMIEFEARRWGQSVVLKFAAQLNPEMDSQIMAGLVALSKNNENSFPVIEVSGRTVMLNVPSQAGYDPTIVMNAMEELSIDRIYVYPSTDEPVI